MILFFIEVILLSLVLKLLRDEVQLPLCQSVGWRGRRSQTLSAWQTSSLLLELSNSR